MKDRNRLYWVDFKRIPSVCPPVNDQTAIVRFLRHAGGRVEAFIRAKTRLIALLNEQKQAIIGRTVTRGLDPGVRLKASGIPWLGDIPEHWQTMKLGHVADPIVSNVDKHSRDTEEPIRLCNYTDIYRNKIIKHDILFMKATATKSEINRFKIKIGDVIITKDSEVWDDIGVPALVSCEAPDLLCGYHLAILRPHQNELTGPFLFLALQHRPIATYLHVRAKGVTRFGLSQQAIRGLLLPIPPFDEQSHIAEDATFALREVDDVMDHARQEIKLLIEFRTRLIVDVVTGQLDVREAALHLPDEAAEPDATSDLKDLADDAELDPGDTTDEDRDGDG